MALIAKASGDGGGGTPAPEGAHQAVCVDVIDKGMVESNFDGKPKMQHKVSVCWQIDEKRDDGKRFLVYKRYTLSLNEKATLRKDLESWRGRAFTRDEEMGFDVETVIGANCLINVQHAKKGDKTYANVVSVMPLFKGMTKIAPLDYAREETPAENANHDEPDPPPSSEYEDSVPF
jgi:hypothetical protein